MYEHQRMANDDFAKGTLTDTSVKISMANAPIPATITLNSAAAGRAIKLGTNGESGEFHTSTVDVTTATMQIVVVTAPISHVEFVGQVGDTWRIR